MLRAEESDSMSYLKAVLCSSTFLALTGKGASRAYRARGYRALREIRRRLSLFERADGSGDERQLAGTSWRRERGLPGPDMVLSIETSPEMTSSSKTPSAAVGSTSIASSSSSPISTRNRPLQRWPTEYFLSQWKHRPLSRLSRISAEVYFLMGKPEVAWAVGAGKNLGTPDPPSVVVAGCEVGTDRIALRFRRLVEVEVFLDIEDPLMRIFSSKLRDIQPHTVVFRHPGCFFGIFSIHSLTSCRGSPEQGLPRAVGGWNFNL
nr:hypothetical protein Iba_chr15aCG12910 [Ipomoea batatas]